jgi:hypothetical protein
MIQQERQRKKTLPKAKGVREDSRAMSCFKQFTVSQASSFIQIETVNRAEEGASKQLKNLYVANST